MSDEPKNVSAGMPMNDAWLPIQIGRIISGVEDTRRDVSEMKSEMARLGAELSRVTQQNTTLTERVDTNIRRVDEEIKVIKGQVSKLSEWRTFLIGGFGILTLAASIIFSLLWLVHDWLPFLQGIGT